MKVACKNCKHFTDSAHSRYTAKGEMIWNCCYFNALATKKVIDDPIMGKVVVTEQPYPQNACRKNKDCECKDFEPKGLSFWGKIKKAFTWLSLKW